MVSGRSSDAKTLKTGREQSNVWFPEISSFPSALRHLLNPRLPPPPLFALHRPPACGDLDGWGAPTIRKFSCCIGVVTGCIPGKQASHPPTLFSFFLLHPWLPPSIPTTFIGHFLQPFPLFFTPPSPKKPRIKTEKVTETENFLLCLEETLQPSMQNFSFTGPTVVRLLACSSRLCVCAHTNYSSAPQ